MNKFNRRIIRICIGLPLPALPNHPGRAALISGAKRYPASQNIPISNRSASSNSASSPTFDNVEHIRSYSLSRTHSDQSPNMSHLLSSIPLTNRRTSTSDVKEKSRRASSQLVRAPKSLREWHEQPANLLEQPFLLDNVNVQILSPHSERTHPSLFSGNTRSKSEDNLNTELENDDDDHHHHRAIRVSDANEN
ncbi:unnamed protein product [Rotaria magnacalcarata]|uniref:Uncharacterized protein n=2 Tax=Rotaria magnacalcarata TaxID=392030 RepID=A0A816QVA6_9BILA|nr:unnamed protein product [Rotaria magnacalcarata]